MLREEAVSAFDTPLPHGEDRAPARARSVLVIACGALAREILAICAANQLDHIELTCLPAQLHNTPDKIPEAVKGTIEENRDRYSEILVAYADCGTGGLLDRVLEDTGARRIDGAHCYAFFAGLEAFDRLEQDQLGTFYLTDFLARHFQTMVVEPLGLDWNPELRDLYFGNYSRVLYMAQTDDPSLENAARFAAKRLGLPFEMTHTGYGLLGDFLNAPGKASDPGSRRP